MKLTEIEEQMRKLTLEKLIEADRKAGFDVGSDDYLKNIEKFKQTSLRRLPRERVFERKHQLSVIERRLTEVERRELGELNARISYVLNEDCICPECQSYPPATCKAAETASCPCPCHGDGGALAVDGIVWVHVESDDEDH